MPVEPPWLLPEDPGESDVDAHEIVPVAQRRDPLTNPAGDRVKSRFIRASMDDRTSTTRRPGFTAMKVLGLALMVAGILAPASAGATFPAGPGGSNGNVAFAAICSSDVGQAVYSISPNGSPPPTYTCPGGTSPNYTQSTAGSIDAMPYFSSQGTTLYFSSNRLASGNNPGSNGRFAVYEAPYPPTVSGSPGSQTDNAVQITFPGSSDNDYAPTVSADGSEMAFIRCNAGSTSCALYTQSPIATGVATEIATSVPVMQPNPASGEASRPEIDPADDTQVIYEGTDGHLHLVSLQSPAAFTERDLSAESGITSGQVDEYPDWNGAGTSIIFDRSQSIYVFYGINPIAGTTSACQLWATDPGTEIEPLFAPTDLNVASGTSCNPSGNMYVWTKLGGGTNITLDMGHSVSNPAVLDNLTQNHTNNSQTTWQPTPMGAETPEAPMSLLLPLAGGAILAGAFLLELNRRRKGETPRGHPLISGATLRTR
jgi:hypothetical protein